MTLPGFDAYPDPAPTKTAAGYLAWLHEQDYPDGWRFWALAGSVGRQQRGSEWVYLIRRGDISKRCVPRARHRRPSDRLGAHPRSRSPHCRRPRPLQRPSRGGRLRHPRKSMTPEIWQS